MDYNIEITFKSGNALLARLEETKYSKGENLILNFNENLENSEFTIVKTRAGQPVSVNVKEIEKVFYFKGETE